MSIFLEQTEFSIADALSKTMLKAFLSSPIVLVGSLTFGFQPAIAEVVPDNTLPIPSSVTREGRVRIIEGGTRRGGNLFHSFEEFSISAGETASFRGVSADIDRLFARVTGSSISTIDGAIAVVQPNGTISSADVFLLNPNGILFGANASLNIGGSLIATTAEQINFADGTQFSAIAPETSPLLTVSVPVGLQFGSDPGRIINRSVAPLRDETGDLILDEAGNPIPVGLQVSPGQTLGLIGGSIAIPGGLLTAEAGRIEIGSVLSADAVTLTRTAEWLANYRDVQSFGSVRLSQGAFLNVSGEGGGAIHVQGDRIRLIEGSRLFARTLGSQNSQGITVQASQLTLDNGAFIAAGTSGSGAGGTVAITANQLQLLNGSQIGVGSLGAGRGGNIRIVNADSVELVGGITRQDPEGNVEFSPSGFFAPTTQTARGGDIAITTRSLSLRDGAQIVVDARGEGDAGSITVSAISIELAGVGRSESGETLLSGNVPRSPSGLIAGTDLSGDGNTIIISTQRLQMRDGAVIQSSTAGSGDAGDLRIQASESIAIVGRESQSQAPTGLLTFSGGIPGVLSVNPEATGQGGNLQIISPELIIRDGALAATGSINPTREAEGAGSIRFQGGVLRLENNGRLAAATASGDGGDITVNAQAQVVLRHNSEVSTTAGSAGAGGNGGNIQINADFVVAVPSENSDITANAFAGNGGSVNIVTQALLGITPRDRLTAESDITATSARGVVGDITITSPDLDPRTGLADLPNTPIRTELAQGCEPTGGQVTASFFNQGRGGIRPAPDEPLSSTAPLEDLRLPVETSAAWVEAQGWVVDQQGAIVLVAVPPTVLAHCQLR